MMRTPNDVTPRDRLRVGLLIDSYQQPQWIYQIVGEIAASDVAEIALLIQNGGGQINGAALKSGRHALYRIYTALDNRIFDGATDAFRDADIESLVRGCPVVCVIPQWKDGCDYFSDGDIAAIQAQDLDVALCFGFGELRGAALRIARYGVWSYDHADYLRYRGGPPGFWEVMEAHRTSGSVLRILKDSCSGDQVIYRSLGLTDARSVRRNLASQCWQSSAFVMRKLRALREYGPAVLQSDGGSAAWNPYSCQPHETPGNARMTVLFTRLLARYGMQKLRDLVYFNQWILAYQVDGNAGCLSESFHNFKLAIPPKDRFWADPFPVTLGDRRFIFFEELPYTIMKGHLCCVEVKPDGSITEPQLVLNRPYHLSYPFVFQWKGTHYMIPETSHARTVELYRCASFPGEWALESTLMENVNAVDTTLVEIAGEWWMFTSMAVEGVREVFELHLFHSETPFGPWKPHRQNPIKCDISARPAGAVIQQNGRLYRPTQSAYGEAVLIYKIDRINAREFEETHVSTIQPRWTDHLIGTHTFNTAGGLTVIDGLRRRRR
jgi:hypothetical protein